MIDYETIREKEWYKILAGEYLDRTHLAMETRTFTLFDGSPKTTEEWTYEIAHRYPQYEYSDYKKDHSDSKRIQVALVMATIMNDLEFVINNLYDKIIETLIECAIDNEKHEIQVYLTDYKYKHNLFQKKELELL